MKSNSARFITIIFEKFIKHNVQYCVLRNYKGLPEDHGNDIDLLINKYDVDTAVKIIINKSEKFNYIYLQKLCRQGYIGIYFFDKDILSIVQFDIYFGIYFKGVPLANVEDILDSRKIYKNFYVPAEGCEAAVTLPKDLLMHRSVKDREETRKRIAKCVSEDSENFSKILSPIFGDQLTNKIIIKSIEQDWESIGYLTNKLRINAALRVFARHPIQQSINWLIFIAYHIRLMTIKSPGLFVCIIGPDGAGKSTITAFIRDSLYDKIFKKYKYIHKDFQILPQLKLIKNIFKRSTKVSGKNLRDNPILVGMVRPHYSLRSAMYISYYFIDFMLGHFAVRYYRWKNGLIIADRYFYDYLYQRVYSNIPYWYPLLLSKFIPKPDVTICLFADSRTIYERKPELDTSEIERQLSEIKKLSSKIQTVIWIDSGVALEDSKRCVIDNLFNYLKSRDTMR